MKKLLLAAVTFALPLLAYPCTDTGKDLLEKCKGEFSYRKIGWKPEFRRTQQIECNAKIRYYAEGAVEEAKRRGFKLRSSCKNNSRGQVDSREELIKFIESDERYLTMYELDVIRAYYFCDLDK